MAGALVWYDGSVGDGFDGAVKYQGGIQQLRYGKARGYQ